MKPDDCELKPRGFAEIENLVEDHVLNFYQNNSKEISVSGIFSKQNVSEEERLRKITDGMPSLVAFIDLNQCYQYVNKSFQDWFGPLAKNLLGRTIREAFSIEDYEKLKPYILKVLNGIPVRFEAELTYSKGTRRHVRVHYTPQLDKNKKVEGFVCLVNDISDLKQTELDLKESEQSFRTLTETMPQLVWATSPEGYGKYFNQRWYEFTGLTEKQSKSFLLGPILYSKDRGRVLRRWKKSLQSGEPFQIDCRLKKAVDGIYRWHLVRALPLRNENGKINKWLGTCTGIDDQKEAEQKLKEAIYTRDKQAALLKTITDNAASCLFMMDQKGYPTFMNPAAERVTGYKLEDIADRPLHYSIHYQKLDGQLYDISECPIVKAHYDFVEKKNEEESFLRKDGTHFPVSYSITPFKEDGLIVGSVLEFRDISEQKKTEDFLKTQSHVLKSMTEGVSLSNENGTIVYTNPAEDLMFGYETGELIGKPLTIQNRNSPKENKAKKIEITRDLRTKGFWVGQFNNTKKDGTQFLTKAHITTLPISGKEYWVCVQEDITQQNKNELERAELLGKVKRQLEELTRSNTELKRFAYVASHDLVEPLRTITIYGQLLEREYKNFLDENASKYLEFIIVAGKRMYTLIQDLLSYSRVNTQSEPFKPLDCEILLQEVIANLQGTISNTSAVIQYGKMPTVLGNATQIRQVFQNLISNGIKFQPEGQYPEIKITVSEAEKSWQFSIANNGIGIAPQYQENIFEIFKRIHSRDKFPGTGIGLAICKQIIEAHGGRIKVESQVNQGCKFIFTLPKV